MKEESKRTAYKQQQKIDELKSNEAEIENIDVADFTYEKMKKWMQLKNMHKILYLKGKYS